MGTPINDTTIPTGILTGCNMVPVSYTHLDVYKRQVIYLGVANSDNAVIRQGVLISIT